MRSTSDSKKNSAYSDMLANSFDVDDKDNDDISNFGDSALKMFWFSYDQKQAQTFINALEIMNSFCKDGFETLIMKVDKEKFYFIPSNEDIKFGLNKMIEKENLIYINTKKQKDGSDPEREEAKVGLIFYPNVRTDDGSNLTLTDYKLEVKLSINEDGNQSFDPNPSGIFAIDKCSLGELISNLKLVKSKSLEFKMQDIDPKYAKADLNNSTSPSTFMNDYVNFEDPYEEVEQQEQQEDSLEISQISNQSDFPYHKYLIGSEYDGYGQVMSTENSVIRYHKLAGFRLFSDVLDFPFIEQEDMILFQFSLDIDSLREFCSTGSKAIEKEQNIIFSYVIADDSAFRVVFRIKDKTDVIFGNLANVFGENKKYENFKPFGAYKLPYKYFFDVLSKIKIIGSDKMATFSFSEDSLLIDYEINAYTGQLKDADDDGSAVISAQDKEKENDLRKIKIAHAKILFTIMEKMDSHEVDEEIKKINSLYPMENDDDYFLNKFGIFIG